MVVDSFRSGFGPYATRDIQRAVDAGRFEVGDIAIAWNLVVWAIVGASEAICEAQIDATQLDDAVTTILGLVGMDPAEAAQVVASIPTANDHTINEPGRT